MRKRFVPFQLLLLVYADYLWQMVEEILRLLTLHIAWKSRHLSRDPEPTEEDIKYRDTLGEQRDSVIEKVTEFAVGSDTKPSEGVKRAVRFSCLISAN